MIPKLRLNCGSGQRPFGTTGDGAWINIDIQKRWNPDVVADIRSMPMFEDNTAEYIVLHHVMEHFGLGECDDCIRECYRILAPGGSLIVMVPDIDALVKRWIRKEITDYIFFTNVYGAYLHDEADRHKWGFIGKTLAEGLRSAVTEWREIKSFDWRPIEQADLARDWWILGVEAVK